MTRTWIQQWWLSAALLTLTLSAAVSCSHAPPPPPVEKPKCGEPEQLYLVVSGSDRMNLDEGGQSLATVMRAYQMKSIDKLQDVNYPDLWQGDSDALGPDLLATKEFTLSPGGKLQVKIARESGAEFLVVMGIFRQESGTAWRAVKRLGPPDEKSCKLGPDGKPGPAQRRIEVRVEDYRVEVL